MWTKDLENARNTTYILRKNKEKEEKVKSWKWPEFGNKPEKCKWEITVTKINASEKY